MQGKKIAHYRKDKKMIMKIMKNVSEKIIT